MGTPTGELSVKFRYNQDTDEMTCVCKIEGHEVDWDLIFRAYVALGGALNTKYSEVKYGILTEEDNLRVCKRIDAEIDKKEETE